MAGKSTISITFKLDGDTKGFKDLAKDAEGLKKVVTSTLSEAQQLSTKAINFAALATGIDAVQRSFNQLHGAMKDLSDAYAIQETAEKRLETVMKQRMGATDAEVQAIKDLASAQQAIGIIGDEVQLSGAQQLSTFLNQKSSLDVLIPAMNNLVAQQKGVNATTQDAVNVGNLMGKVMQGQTAALTRVGITFDEAEAKVLKFGTEEEKAAMLAQVITNNVGQMNTALAATESGKIQQVVNTLGDYKEVIGGIVNDALPFVTITAQASTALAGVSTLIAGIKTLTTTVYKSIKAFALSTATLIKNKTVTLATAAAQKMVTVATAAWTAVQKVLNLILTANPIGILIVAIGALVAALVKAYNSSEDFRRICDAVWSVIGPLADAIIHGLAAAFEWLCEKCKQAWNWLKNILGLGGQKAEVEVEVKTTQKDGSSPDLSAMKSKYANYSLTGKDSGAKTDTPAAEVSNGLIGQLEAKIQDARKRLRDATSEAAIESINKEIETYESELSRYEGLGKKVAEAVEDGIEDNGPVFKADASTLGEITDNISVLNDQLQNATVNEASAINQQIDAWNRKADAIRNAGKVAEKASMSAGEAMGREWQATKQIGNSVQGITGALSGNANAWQIVTGIVDGFIGLYEGFSSVVHIINLMTGASATHAATKGVEATAEATAASATTAAAATNVASTTATIVANKLATASWKELAAAEFMAAHAMIPFVGLGIAAGFIASMEAIVAAAGIPMLAKGGIASGPTLAMVGEYSGASNNPEIIAPLDKLKGMLTDTGTQNVGSVEFKIEGRTLVGVLNKESNYLRRT